MQQCDCDDTTGHKTLGQLRAAVLEALGFIDPLANPSTRTLGQLRTALIERLGFIEPLSGFTARTLSDLREEVRARLGVAEPIGTAVTRSLGSLRTDMLRLLGYGAVTASPPPGTTDQIDAWLNEAQQALWRRLELDQAGNSAPARMSADSDLTTLDYQPVLTLAMAMACAHKGKPESKVYFEEHEKYVADYAARQPPNLDAQIDDALRDAQQTAWRRYELGNETDSLAPLVADADATSMDPVPVLHLALALLKAKAGQPDAKHYADLYERWVEDSLRRSPPGLVPMATRALQDAQLQVARRYQVPDTALGVFAADTDTATLDDVPISLLALEAVASRLGMKDAALYGKQAEQHFVDMERRQPANAVSVATRAVRDAHQTIYDRLGKAGVRTERWFTWPLVEGERFYDLPDNAEQSGDCTKPLNPRLITYVGVQRDSVTHKLIAGIPPEVLGYDTTGLPERYEIRQCIELWPAPDDSNGTLLIKGHFQPAPFETDNDATTVDDHAVYLLSLANAKAYFRQPDAGSVMSQFEVQFQSLVAATHQTRRYIPGASRRAVYVEPKPDVPFA